MVTYGPVRRPAARRKVGVPKFAKRVSSKDVEAMLAKKLMRLERTVRLRKPEEKFVDVGLSAINVADTTGAVQSLVPIAQGSDFNQRIGDSVRIHRIQGHARISTGIGSLGVTPTGEEFARMHIVHDMQQVADTAPAPNIIFQNVSQPASDLLYEAVFHHRFRVLASSPLYVAARLATTSLSGALTVPICPTQTGIWNFDLKCNHVVSFNGTASTDFEKNGLFFVWLTSIAADTADFDGYVRVYYTDL